MCTEDGPGRAPLARAPRDLGASVREDEAGEMKEGDRNRQRKAEMGKILQDQRKGQSMTGTQRHPKKERKNERETETHRAIGETEKETESETERHTERVRQRSTQRVKPRQKEEGNRRG